MSAYPPNATSTAPEQPQSPQTGFRLPLSKPRLSYLFLGINVLVWLAVTALGLTRGYGLNGSQSTAMLLDVGAQANLLVAQGQYVRLLTSMFLHAGLVHLAFNAWALYVLGQDVERLFGMGRFAVIYLLSGLGGSVLFYLLGDNAPSVGASGAIFGLIGAEIIYFWIYRSVFGQQQLRSLLMVTVVNLIFGFSMPGINNLAHIGGLLTGAGVGWLLVPRYVRPAITPWAGTGMATLVDTNSLRKRLPALLLVIAALIALSVAATMRWSNSADMALDQALKSMDAGNYVGMARTLRPLVEAGSDDATVYFYLGVAEANLNGFQAASEAWERTVELEPGWADVYWNLALVYNQLRETDKAIAALNAYADLVGADQVRPEAAALLESLKE